MKHLILSGLALAASLFFSGPVTAQPAEPEHVQMRMVPEHQTVQAGETLWVAIIQTIEPGWHTYWVNPGDSGTTPQVKWTAPEGVTAGDILWPAPHRIPYETLMNFGYEGQVVMLQPITLPATLPEGPIEFKASAEILVCRDICIPEFKNLSFSINTGTGVDDTGLFAAARSMLPTPLEGTGTYNIEGNDLIITLVSNALPDNARKSISFFPTEWGITKNSADTRIETPDATTAILRHERDIRELKDISSLPVLLAYNTEEGQYAAVSITLSPDPALAQASPAETASTTPEHSQAPTVSAVNLPPADPLNFVEAILFALLGGFILNLMPCVFPVLSMKALKLVDLQDKNHPAAVRSGFAYTTGILFSFAAIGGSLLLLKSGGSEIGWGFQLQNPLIVLGLIYLLFIIGLNLSGVFEISGSFTNIGSSLTQREGLGGTFFTGVLAALVATPCTAPFMAGALGYALFQPSPVAMGVFLALGFGLALPYLLLCLIPALTKFLPRPGKWMVRFREFLAFPMYASAAWLVWVLSMQAGPSSILWALCGLVLIGFVFWALFHRPKTGFFRIIVLILVLVAAGCAVLPFFNSALIHDNAALASANTSASGMHLDAKPFSASALGEALSSDAPVFTYMTAAWCITCKVNEKIALNADETIAHFRRNNVSVFVGDWTNQNPEITTFLKSHGRNGVPLYVYYGPKDAATGQRPDPVVLPQILTPGIVINATRLNPEPQKD